MDWLRTEPTPATGDRGVRAYRTSGDAARTRPDLLRTWAIMLRLPDHFGHNWDALADAMGDLRPPVAIVVDDAQLLLADEPPAQLATLLAVLGRVARTGGLRVTLRAPEEHLDGLRHRVAVAASRR